MFQGNLTDLARDLGQLYWQITGKEASCALSAPEQEYSEMEQELLGDKGQTGAVMLFTHDGRFHRVGFNGKWHKLISYTAHDWERVFSTDSLDTFGVIKNMGQNEHEEWLAILAA